MLMLLKFHYGDTIAALAVFSHAVAFDKPAFLAMVLDGCAQCAGSHTVDYGNLVESGKISVIEEMVIALDIFIFLAWVMADSYFAAFVSRSSSSRSLMSTRERRTPICT